MSPTCGGSSYQDRCGWWFGSQLHLFRNPIVPMLLYTIVRGYYTVAFFYNIGRKFIPRIFSLHLRLHPDYFFHTVGLNHIGIIESHWLSLVLFLWLKENQTLWPWLGAESKVCVCVVSKLLLVSCWLGWCKLQLWSFLQACLEMGQWQFETAYVVSPCEYVPVIFLTESAWYVQTGIKSEL